MRQLATIRSIQELTPIEGADNIEVAKVLGWRVIVKKGEFQVGDKCVYLEIDSITPERPEFEFLRPKRFRIRTLKLRGQISQGICFPLSIVPSDIDCSEGADVSLILGIEKYEPVLPSQLVGKAKGNFPSFLEKTSETRVQNIEDVLERNQGKVFYIAEKLDGCSFTAYLNQEVYGVCSRNLDLLETEGNAFWGVSRKLKIEESLRNWSTIHDGRNIAFQAEIIGPGIQGNKYQLSEVDLYIFNVYDIDQGKYFDLAELIGFAASIGIKVVPMIDMSFKLEHSVDQLVEMSDGYSQLNNKVRREGFVIRPLIGQSDRKLGRLSFKVINSRFLLKYGDE
jgi:RNA ligase (TIGR02306 family)